MATVSSSSTLIPTKFRVSGIQKSTIRSEISAISVSKLQAKASIHSSTSSFRFENLRSTKSLKQRVPRLFANPSSEEKSEASTEESQGQGPPVLTILAGFAVFFFIAWIVVSIVTWLLSLIFTTVPAK